MRLMKALSTARRLTVMACLALLLLIALTHPVIGLLLAFLILEWFFFAAVVNTPIPARPEPRVTLPFPTLPVFSPRPPPVL